MICIRTGSTLEVYKKHTGGLSICTRLRGVCDWTVGGQPGYYTNSLFHKHFRVLKVRL